MAACLGFKNTCIVAFLHIPYCKFVLSSKSKSLVNLRACIKVVQSLKLLDLGLRTKETLFAQRKTEMDAVRHQPLFDSSVGLLPTKIKMDTSSV